MNYLEEEKEKLNNKPWNYTKIESKNVHGIIDRNDNLPGHFGKVDLSLYYYDIQDKKQEIPDRFKAPHWSSVTRADIQNKNNSEGNVPKKVDSNKEKDIKPNENDNNKIIN